MRLKLGQIWISESHPHESFMIYSGEIDTCTDSEIKYDESFDNQYECNKIFFWDRYDTDAYIDFLTHKLGRTIDTYPYASCGECKKGSLVRKIRKYNMKLSDQTCGYKEPKIM
ncbi:hypothetical protein MHB40_14760 [Lysinibacillus sp. FSL K6-0057]|uniref:hypothetical protein n=1 Tax=Lysinibacillus sp. FSL K6-0057 TaxID=2921411 RepID=UPI00315AF4A0